MTTAPQPLNPVQKIAAKEMYEDELRTLIEALCKVLKWRIYWTHRSDRSPAGFPDLVMAHNDGRVLFVELKRETTKPRPNQREWLDTLGKAAEASHGAVEVDVWRPRDWFNGNIRRTLEVTRPAA